jgi:hypothetical protein
MDIDVKEVRERKEQVAFLSCIKHTRATFAREGTGPLVE